MDKFIPKVDESVEVEELREELSTFRHEYAVGSIGELLEELKEKDFYDKDLGKTIRETLSDAIEKINKSEQEKKYFDTELGATIKKSLSEALVGIAKIMRPPIDMSPVIKIAADISEQNKKIVETVSKLTKPETNDAKYQELLKSAMEMIARNNEFVENGFLQLAKPEKKSGEWEVTITEREKYEPHPIKKMIIKTI